MRAYSFGSLSDFSQEIAISFRLLQSYLYCMKLCPICEQKLPLSKFHKNPNTSDRRGTYCKQCDADHRRVIGQEKKAKLVKLLGGACRYCGYNLSMAALDFHHKDSNKEKNISELLKSKYETVRQEAEKCTLLCSNCHREEHYKPTIRRINARKPRKHGTSAMYRFCGPPKCDECKRFKREYMRKYMARKRAENLQ